MNGPTRFLLSQVRGSGGDHLVQPPADQAAGVDPGRPQHPQLRADHEHPAGTQGRIGAIAGLTCEKVGLV